MVVLGDSLYIALATAELKKRVEAELLIQDPPKEIAKAILKGHEETNRDT